MKRAFVIVALLGAAAWAADEKLLLLTANGRGNAQYSQYKNAPLADLPGAGYYAVPEMDMEKSSEKNPVPFDKGILTNGDTSSDHKRNPRPYTHWSNKKQGELFFEFGQACQIRKVRVFLQEGPAVGCSRIRIYDRGNPLEFPEALLMAQFDGPKPGWNEFGGLDRLVEGLRLVLDAAPGKPYLTVAEVEVWGAPAARDKSAPALAGPAPAAAASGGAAPRAFDFGTEKSPVAPGFTRVWRDTAYTREAGYGWVVPRGRTGQHLDNSAFTPPSKVVAGLLDRDRGETLKGMVEDALHRDFVGAQAAYHTQTRHEFAVDMPNGRYLVATFHGDVHFGHFGTQRFSIDAEGRRVVQDPWFPGVKGRCEFEVDVDDGQLNLVFDGTDADMAKRHWGCGGVIVLAADNARERDQARRQLAAVLASLDEAREKDFKAAFVEKPHVEKNPMPAPSEQDKARGFMVFVPNWMEMVYPNTVPTPASQGRALSAFACRGEREPFTVAARSVAAVRGLSVSVSELRGPGVIPASAFDARLVRYHPQRIGSSWSREWRVMPQILDPARAVDMEPGATRQFWLTLTVPRDAAAGVYAGEVVLKSEAGAARLPLRLEVLPFDLAAPGKWVGMYWHVDRCRDREEMKRHLADMRAHGMNTIAGTPPAPKMTLKDGKLVMDATETIEFLDLLKSEGFTGPVPFDWREEALAKRLFGADRVKEGVKALVTEWLKITNRPGGPPLMYYPVDEIGNHADRQKEFNHKAALIRQVLEAKIYCTVNKFDAGEKCVEGIDYWCSNIPFTLDQEKYVRDHGKVYMRYGSHYTKDPRKARNSAGFGFFRRDAAAMYYWHYQHICGDPFDDLDANCREHCAAYPGPDGPIPTLDWEGVGEGVDDLRYINTLNLAIEQAKKRGGPAAAAAERARGELKALLEADTTTSAYDFMSKLSDDEFHGLRRKVVDLILLVSGAK